MISFFSPEYHLALHSLQPFMHYTPSVFSCHLVDALLFVVFLVHMRHLARNNQVLSLQTNLLNSYVSTLNDDNMVFCALPDTLRV
jgi:hypothetical protein